jgi:hypothetical protein
MRQHELWAGSWIHDETRTHRRGIWRLLALLMVLGALSVFVSLQQAGRHITPVANHGPLLSAPLPISETARLKIAETYGRLPLRFEANQGQTASSVQFLSRGNGYSLFLTSTESVLALSRQAARPRADGHATTTATKREEPRPDRDAVLRMKLLHANHTPAKGLEELPSTSNYFIGNDPKQWRTNVPSYSKVRFEGVYPGVDLVYYGNQRELEYDFIVGPGADASVIRLGFAGARQVEIDPQGELKLQTSAGEVRWHKPVVYQEIGGARQLVDGHYSRKGKKSVGFEVAAYDSRYPLVIDPTLDYSTYLGGSAGGEVAAGIAVDSAGNAYVTGLTGSKDFPTLHPLQTSGSAFVTKLNAAGDGLVYSTYLGGSGSPSGGDEGTGIALDSAGNAYITGYTFSSDFPTTPGAFQTTAAGADNAFVAKLNAAGNALLYSTYLGGSNGVDLQVGIAVDVSGNAYVAGGTTSSDFPTVNAMQPAYGGSEDCFVTKLNPVGSGLLYSTYLGGSGQDKCTSIAVDSTGNAYVTGSNGSTNFPITGSVGKGSGFVTKLNNSGSGMIFSTEFGGISGNNGGAIGVGIAVDSSSNVYLVGGTNATDLPTTLNAFQTTFGGGNADAFVMKLDSAGANILFCSYLGGSAGEQGIAIAVDPSGKIYVTGNTNSVDFPTSDGPQMSFGGGNSDVFVAGIDPASVGSGTLVYSTYLGGSGADHGFAIAVDSAGNAYVSGNAASAVFPTTTGSFQPTFGGGSNDAFVTKIGTTGAGPAASIKATSGVTQSAAITATFGPMTVSVADSGGNGVSGANVTFSAPTSGASGTFTGGGTTVSVVTNSSGAATSPTFTANTIAGSYSVTASVAGIATAASFSLTNNPGPPAGITATAGTSQSVLIGSAFATTLKATVKDAGGNGVPGITVAFAAPASGAGGTFAGGGATASVTTDSSGLATAPAFTASSTSGGPYNVTATAAGVATPATFTLTNVDYSLQQATTGTVQITAGSPANITLNLTTAPAGAALPADVNYTCSAPASLIGATCALNPTKTSAGSTSGNTTLTITTTASVPPLSRPTDPRGPYLFWIMATALAWLMATFLVAWQKILPLRGRPVYVSLALLVIIMAGLAGCSSASKPASTPKGPATVTVTSTSGTVSKTTAINIDVK